MLSKNKYLLMLLLMPLISQATVITQDNFNDGTAQGWSNSSNSDNWLKINKDKTAEKTYELGSQYANKKVFITFKAKGSDNWDKDDKLEFYINDNQHFERMNRREYSHNVEEYGYTDSDGKLTISIKPNTDDMREVIYIDDIKLMDFDNTKIFESEIGEFGNDIDEATNITTTQNTNEDFTLNIVGNSEESGDKDYIKFKIPSDGTIDVTFTALDDGDKEMYISIYDDEKNQLFDDKTESDGIKSKTGIKVKKDEYIYIKVKESGGESDNYNIKIDFKYPEILEDNRIIYNETFSDTNEECGGEEIITPLDNINEEKTVYLMGDSASGEDDYYKFKIGYDGTINIKGTEKNEEEYYLQIGTEGCNTSNIYEVNKDNEHIIDFPVKRNDIVRLRVRGSGDRDYYQLKIDYKPVFGLPGDVRTGYAGPVGEIGYKKLLTSNEDKSTGTTYLVDDDKKECSNAKFDNLEDAIDSIKRSFFAKKPTIVLCKGNYDAPNDTIESISDLTITSNYDEANGTIINGTLKFDSVSNLTISYIDIESKDDGIQIDYPQDSLNLRNLIINSNKIAINASHVEENINIENSELFSINNNAIEITGEGKENSKISNILIGNNKEEITGGMGIQLEINNMKMNNLSIYSHETSLKINNSPNTEIKDSILFNDIESLITIDGSNDVIIDNSKLLANSGYGIDIYKSLNTKITSSVIEAFRKEAINLSESNGGYFQNNCFATNFKIYDFSIKEDMDEAIFNNETKGNFYNNAEYIDKDNNNINDYPFHLVINHNKIYTDFKPQIGCNYGLYDSIEGEMFLNKIVDKNPLENIVEDNAPIGTGAKITAYTQNSLSINSDKKEKINLILIADISGSMYLHDITYNGTTTTKLKVLEESLKLLVEKYSQTAEVKYDLIQFSGRINNDTNWTDIKTTPVPDLMTDAKGTDYYTVLKYVMNTTIVNMPEADKTFVYFMSDGLMSEEEDVHDAFYSEEKTEDTDGDGKKDSTFLEWWYKSIVMNPDIYKTYTYGISEINEDLNAVSIQEEGYKTPNPILMENPEDILKELLKTLNSIIEYSLTDNYNNAFYIDKYSGEVFVQDSSPLDVDIDNLPKITVKGSDLLNNLSIQKDFNIQLKKGFDNSVSTEECNVFADAIQTRTKDCSDIEGINWENEAVVKNNPDNKLNTCNINLKEYLEQNEFNTCDTEKCMQSQTIGKTIGINYENNVSIVSLTEEPSSSIFNKEYIDKETDVDISYLNELTSENSILNVNTTNIENINIIKKIAINTIKTDNSTIKFVPNETEDIEIGYLIKKYNGEKNTIITNENVDNLKIHTLTLTGNTNIDFKAQTSIKMNNMSLGRGGVINLTAPIVSINTTDLTNYGNGITYINIKADVINMETLDIKENYIIKIEPYTPNNKLLFRAKDVSLSSSAIMKLGNGDYYINGSLIVLSNGESIEAIDENQDINIYINNKLYLENNAVINSDGTKGEYGDLPAENFKMFINGDFKTNGGGATINGLLYVEGNAELGSPTFINGALSAKSTITLNQGSEIVYDRNIINTKYGACPVITTAKPIVSFFKAWDKEATDEKIGVKIVNQPFDLNIASISNEDTDLNVEFNAWLQDIDTGEVLTLPKLSFNQKINDVTTKSFKVTGAYKDVHMMFEICSDYDAATNEYKLYNFDSCDRVCNYDLETTEGNPCIRTVQGEEGFAVRPNTFDIKIYSAGTLNSDNPDLLDNTNNLISGTTYKAGENFDIEVKALDIDGEIVSNFNEDFDIEITKANSNMIVNGEFISNTKNDSMTFENGKLEFSGNYSEVGVINIKVTPNEDFASIDKSVSDTNYIIPSITFNAGRFIPYAFEIENVNLKDIKGNNNINRTDDCKYNYLNETTKDLTNLKYALTIYSINKNGEITQNYDGDFAKETNIAFDVNWRNISSKNITGNQKIKDIMASVLWIKGTYTTPTGSEFVKNIDILSSIGVNRKQPFEPFAISLKDETNIYTNNINITDSEVTTTIDTGNRTFDITTERPDTLYYVYGRINPIDAISTPGGNAKVSIYYELYSDKNTNTLKTILGSTNLKESVNDSKWWRNTKHKICDTVLTENLDISFNTLNTNIVSGNYDYTNADKDIIEIENTSTQRPIDTTVTIKFDTNNSFLFHDAYSNIKESRFNIKFVGNISNNNNKVDSINNIGKNTTNQSRFIR